MQKEQKNTNHKIIQTDDRKDDVFVKRNFSEMFRMHVVYWYCEMIYQNSVTSMKYAQSDLQSFHILF